jgi:hypothetical protein
LNRELQKWEEAAVSGLFFLAIGAILIVWGFQAAEQIQVEQIGSQVTASLDPTFIVLFMCGCFSVGLGVGALSFTYTIYKLEKQPVAN